MAKMKVSERDEVWQHGLWERTGRFPLLTRIRRCEHMGHRYWYEGGTNGVKGVK